MKTRTVELAVGIFVILFAAALFLLSMRASGLAGENLGDSYQLTAKFDNVSGLKPRAKVTISGVKVGQVSKITFDPVSNKAIVTLVMSKAMTTFNPTQLKETEKFAIDNLKYSDEYQQATPAQQKAMEKQLIDNMKNITSIDKDAYLKVATNGIIGEKYLKIEPGGSFEYIPQGGQFADTQTQGTVEIEDLINKFIGSKALSPSSNSDEKSASANDSVTADSSDTSTAEPSFIE